MRSHTEPFPPSDAEPSSRLRWPSPHTSGEANFRALLAKPLRSAKFSSRQSSVRLGWHPCSLLAWRDLGKLDEQAPTRRDSTAPSLTAEGG